MRGLVRICSLRWVRSRETRLASWRFVDPVALELLEEMRFLMGDTRYLGERYDRARAILDTPRGFRTLASLVGTLIASRDVTQSVLGLGIQLAPYMTEPEKRLYAFALAEAIPRIQEKHWDMEVGVSSTCSLFYWVFMHMRPDEVGRFVQGQLLQFMLNAFDDATGTLRTRIAQYFADMMHGWDTDARETKTGRSRLVTLLPPRKVLEPIVLASLHKINTESFMVHWGDYLDGFSSQDDPLKGLPPTPTDACTCMHCATIVSVLDTPTAPKWTPEFSSNSETILPRAHE